MTKSATPMIITNPEEMATEYAREVSERLQSATPKKVKCWSCSRKIDKKVSKPVKVEFYTKDGGKVSFKGHKEVTKPVKVEFYVKKGKKIMNDKSTAGALTPYGEALEKITKLKRELAVANEKIRYYEDEAKHLIASYQQAEQRLAAAKQQVTDTSDNFHKEMDKRMQAERRLEEAEDKLEVYRIERLGEV